MQPHGLLPARLICPWDFPGKNTGAGCHFFLQGIFLTQGSNPHLRHWQAILDHWAARKLTSIALITKSDFCCSVSKWCPILCILMDCSMPGIPVLHYLLEFAQVHAHWVRLTEYQYNQVAVTKSDAWGVVKHIATNTLSWILHRVSRNFYNILSRITVKTWWKAWLSHSLFFPCLVLWGKGKLEEFNIWHLAL